MRTDAADLTAVALAAAAVVVLAAAAAGFAGAARHQSDALSPVP
jgi:hypothetical protein